MKGLLPLLVFVFLFALGGLTFVYTGSFNVAATAPHAAATRWLFNTTMEHSVARRARDVEAPPAALERDERAGFLAYREMCVGCHGAPGVERSAVGKGLLPKPPDLDEAADEWSSKELFWIIKNGIKMTGMPAWGTTHSDKELWQIVAFLKTLPLLSPRQYRTLDQAAESETAGHSHQH